MKEFPTIIKNNTKNLSPLNTFRYFIKSFIAFLKTKKLSMKYFRGGRLIEHKIMPCFGHIVSATPSSARRSLGGAKKQRSFIKRFHQLRYCILKFFERFLSKQKARTDRRELFFTYNAQLLSRAPNIALSQWTLSAKTFDAISLREKNCWRWKKKFWRGWTPISGYCVLHTAISGNDSWKMGMKEKFFRLLRRSELPFEMCEDEAIFLDFLIGT